MLSQRQSVFLLTAQPIAECIFLHRKPRQAFVGFAFAEFAFVEFAFVEFAFVEFADALPLVALKGLNLEDSLLLRDAVVN